MTVFFQDMKNVRCMKKEIEIIIINNVCKNVEAWNVHKIFCNSYTLIYVYNLMYGCMNFLKTNKWIHL